jgi:SNF2 family DNA or RNA helicase
MKDLRWYQLEDAAYGETRDFIANYECGVGKTLLGIEVGKRMRDRLPNTKINLVVLSPKVTATQWRDEIMSQDPGVPVEIWESMDDVHPLDKLKPFWVIAHYAAIVSMRKVFKAWLWATIIADEVHNIKNDDSHRTVALKSLNGMRKIGLTATPIEKAPHDLWSLLNWVSPDAFPHITPFKQRYVRTVNGFRGFPKIVGGQNLEELAEKIAPFFRRRTKVECFGQLDPINQFDVRVEMEGVQARAYRQMKDADDILVTLETVEDPIIVANALTRMTRLQQLASDPQLLGVKASSAKLDWLYEYVHNNPDEKIVIFTRFRETAERISKRLGSAIVTGKLVAGLHDFREGGVQTLVGTIRAMGTGLDLPMATTAIIFDPEYSSVLMSQAIERIRPGISGPTNIIRLKAKGGADARMLKGLDHKWTEAELVYDFFTNDEE